jgi:hypothetical protein
MDTDERTGTMSRKWIAGLATVAALALSGAALAAGPPAGGGLLAGTGARLQVGTVKLAAAADYLGMTVTALRTELRSGDTVAEIAQARGKTADGLEAAIVAAVDARLDKLVAAGTITQAQADAVLANVKANVGDMLDRTCTPRGTGAGAGHGRGPAWARA